MPIIQGIIASSYKAGGSFESIATVTVGSGGTSTITFSSIPSTYKHLQIRMIYTGSGTDNLSMTLNGSTTSTYWHYLTGDGSTAGAGSNTANYLSAQFGNSSTIFYAGVLDILDYTNTNKNKTIRMLNGVDYNGSGGIALTSNLFSTTSAISSVSIAMRLGATISQYSQFALYGVKG